jgi:hypothetical protein
MDHFHIWWKRNKESYKTFLRHANKNDISKKKHDTKHDKPHQQIDTKKGVY